MTMSRADVYRSRRVGAAVRGGFVRLGKPGTAKEKERLKKDLYKLWNQQMGTTCPLLCGRRLTPRRSVFCHDISLAMGGSHTASNIFIGCRSCNKSQHTLTKNEYLKFRQLIVDNFGNEFWEHIRKWIAGSKF